MFGFRLTGLLMQEQFHLVREGSFFEAYVILIRIQLLNYHHRFEKHILTKRRSTKNSSGPNARCSNCCCCYISISVVTYSFLDLGIDTLIRLPVFPEWQRLYGCTVHHEWQRLYACIVLPEWQRLYSCTVLHEWQHLYAGTVLHEWQLKYVLDMITHTHQHTHLINSQKHVKTDDGGSPGASTNLLQNGSLWQGRLL